MEQIITGNFNSDIRYPMEDSGNIVQRCPENPILTAKDTPYSCNSIFNPAAVMYGEETILVFRVENKVGFSALGLARSKDGVHFEIYPEPILLPSTEEPFARYEVYGLSDPRVSKIGEAYYLVYAAYSELGVHPVVARTYDFISFERISLIAEPDNRNVVLFPELINGEYVRLDRPMGEINTAPGIWISYSPDLVYWGKHQFVMGPRPVHWDCNKIGPGAPPIKTERGWLEIYHGVRKTVAGDIYRLGCVLLDLNDPARIIGRAMPYILSPEEPYERSGDVGNVVFAGGAVLDDYGETIRIYYGASDQCVCLATARVDDLISLCVNNVR